MWHKLNSSAPLSVCGSYMVAFMVPTKERGVSSGFGKLHLFAKMISVRNTRHSPQTPWTSSLLSHMHFSCSNDYRKEAFWLYTGVCAVKAGAYTGLYQGPFVTSSAAGLALSPASLPISSFFGFYLNGLSLWANYLVLLFIINAHSLYSSIYRSPNPCEKCLHWKSLLWELIKLPWIWSLIDLFWVNTLQVVFSLWTFPQFPYS